MTAPEADVLVITSPEDIGAIVRDSDLVALISAKAGLFDGFLYETGRLLSRIDQVVIDLENELGS